jgi:hypothetical protein
MLGLKIQELTANDPPFCHFVALLYFLFSSGHVQMVGLHLPNAIEKTEEIIP